jgi:hypothetical protein
MKFLNIGLTKAVLRNIKPLTNIKFIATSFIDSDIGHAQFLNSIAHSIILVVPTN